MSSEEVIAMVKEELAKCSDLANWHGINIDNVRSHLLSPQVESFVNSCDQSLLKLWSVLDEIPGRQEGYLIVFDENRQAFGLALKPYDGKPGTFLGYCGTLIETLKGM